MEGRLSVKPPSIYRHPRKTGGKNPEKNGIKAEHSIAFSENYKQLYEYIESFKDKQADSEKPSPT